MRNKEILRLLFIDKIKKDIKKEVFNSEEYWVEFITSSTYGYEFWPKTYEEILLNIDNEKLSILKMMYKKFLLILEKDKKTFKLLKRNNK